MTKAVDNDKNLIIWSQKIESFSNYTISMLRYTGHAAYIFLCCSSKSDTFLEQLGLVSTFDTHNKAI